MASRRIQVLVIDDSPLMRRMIGDAISAAPDMEVVGTAADGTIAMARVRQLQPDVATLDIQMPGIDGLTALGEILSISPLPVIMVSSLTQRSAEVTLNALDRGAIDYVAKPETAAEARAVFTDELIRKIRVARCVDVAKVMQIRKRRRPAGPANRPRPAAAADKFSAAVPGNGTCIAVGISTGGPPALTKLFETLTRPMPPMVVVQHMPPQFTAPLALRLNRISDLSVREAASGDALQCDHVYIAPGGVHLHLRQGGQQVLVDLRDGETVSGHKPSVDVMMGDAARIFGPRCLGVVMTGMGRDGANGCREIKAWGGYVLGQDQPSSDVYGMNKAAFIEGHVDQQFPLDTTAATITAALEKLHEKALA